MTVDELRDSGAEHMTESEIQDFLNSHGEGVLGLPGEDVPYVIPMSFGYDGESRLYFAYFLGNNSRKKKLSDQTELARFLVYSARSLFNWESVMLTGEVAPVPDAELDVFEEAMENAWHPNLIKKARENNSMRAYQFKIVDQVGIKHTGLPPEFD